MVTKTRKRCPTGQRKDKKTGKCIGTRKNRCPRGQRRNKTTGKCHDKKKGNDKKKVSKKRKEKGRNAKFYDIANKLDSKYKENQFISMKSDVFDMKIKKHIKDHPSIKTGDILFTGSEHDRQEYGYIVVDKRDNKINWHRGEQGASILFDIAPDLFGEYLHMNDIKYKELFTKMDIKHLKQSGMANKKKDINREIGHTGELISQYKDKGIWN